MSWVMFDPELLLGAVIFHLAATLGSTHLPGDPHVTLRNQLLSDFLAKLCRKKEKFLAFCPSSSTADGRAVSLHANILVASSELLPSTYISIPQNGVILQFHISADCCGAASTPRLAGKRYFGAVNCKKSAPSPIRSNLWKSSSGFVCFFTR